MPINPYQKNLCSDGHPPDGIPSVFVRPGAPAWRRRWPAALPAENVAGSFLSRMTLEVMEVSGETISVSFMCIWGFP